MLHLEDSGECAEWTEPEKEAGVAGENGNVFGASSWVLKML